jgi:beta-lactamase superfamily II metal-dependent hydrolase
VPEVFDGQVRLRWFEDQGKTKNGHSVVLRLVYRNVSILLGGDLNIPAEKYLLEHYERLGLTEGSPDSLMTRHRKFLQVDAAKACHHGSADFTSDFLMALNPWLPSSPAVMRSHSHPRPESLARWDISAASTVR